MREWTIVEGLDICSHVITPVSRRRRQDPVGSTLMVGRESCTHTFIYNMHMRNPYPAYSMIYGSRTVNSYRTNSSVLLALTAEFTLSLIHSLTHSLTHLQQPLYHSIPIDQISRVVSLPKCMRIVRTYLHTSMR